MQTDIIDIYLNQNNKENCDKENFQGKNGC